MKIVFGVLALAAAVFDITANIYQKKWKRLILDIFVCFIQMPLWVILGVAYFGNFSGLDLLLFPGDMADTWIIFMVHTSQHFYDKGNPQKGLL